MQATKHARGRTPKQVNRTEYLLMRRQKVRSVGSASARVQGRVHFDRGQNQLESELRSLFWGHPKMMGHR